MSANSKQTLPNEEAAEFRTGIKGWVCKTCRRFYGDEPDSERIARFCCERDHPCNREGCTGRAERGWIGCANCREKADLERYLKLEEAAWDGETPLVLDDDDKFFHSPEDLEEYLAEHGEPLEHLRLVIAVRDRPPHFDMTEFLSDYTNPDMGWGDGGETRKIDALVNGWIKKHAPEMWTPGKKRPSLASLREHVQEPDLNTKEENDR